MTPKDQCAIAGRPALEEVHATAWRMSDLPKRTHYATTGRGTCRTEATRWVLFRLACGMRRAPCDL